VNQKKIGAGLMALAFPVIALSVSVGSANAASVSSTVTAMDACQWQLTGVPGEINMGSASKYFGDALAVTGSTATPIVLGLTGQGDPDSVPDTEIGSSVDCSFYNDKASAGVEIDMGATGTGVDAYYGPGDGTLDESLSFVVDSNNPFTINATSACTPVFTSGASFALDGTPPPSSLVSAPRTGLDNVYYEGTAPRCSIELSYSLTIPSTDEVPDSPGAVYTFKGGVVDFVFVATRASAE
jgi:hypothetical protein